MPVALIIEIAVVCVLLIAGIFYLLRTGKIPVKYSLVWFFSAVIMLITVLIPKFIEKISNFLGFATVASMLYALMIIILLLITIVLTIIVSTQKEKIKLLMQEMSLLKEEVRKE